jgi:hypothetical protein
MDKIEIVEKEIRDILIKNNCKISYSLDFPVYKIIPDEVKLALKVLENNGMKILFTLKENEKSPSK